MRERTGAESSRAGISEEKTGRRSQGEEDADCFLDESEKIINK